MGDVIAARIFRIETQPAHNRITMILRSRSDWDRLALSALTWGGIALLLLPVSAFAGHAQTPKGKDVVSRGVLIDALLPNGRRISPLGAWQRLAPYPFAIAVRRDGGQLAVPSVGWPFSLNILDRQVEGKRTHRIVRLWSAKRLPAAAKSDPDLQVLNGVAYSPDGSLLYVATGDTGAVDIYSSTTWTRVTRISLNGDTAGRTFNESFTSSLVLSADGHTLYVLDQGNWRVVGIDTASGKRISSFETGANPFELALSPDESKLFITNSGLFEYKTVGGVIQQDVLHTGLRFPASGYPSKQAREGGIVDGHAYEGLGSENDVRGSSLWTYALDGGRQPALSAKLRLGQSIREGAGGVVGGAAPIGVVAGPDHVFVSLAHEDAVAVISPDGSRLEKEIPLTPFSGAAFSDSQGRPLRGVMPAGLALAGGRLYVTEAGIDAVGVVDTRLLQVLGHIPAGWYPSAAAVSPDGSQLFVVNTKGRGTGPNGGAASSHSGVGSYIGELEYGSLSTVRLDSEIDFTRTTAQVIANNTAAQSTHPAIPKIKHVFLVIRENRTFDEILGDLPEANGDPELARWGMHGWMRAIPGVKELEVTPNAHALARRFATSDNFFVDSDVSSDGHRWMVAAAETPWFHLAWTSNYGGRRTSDPFSTAPGRRAMTGGDDGVMPEDEPEFGTLWEHVEQAGLRIRNYGEGLELEGSNEMAGSSPEGQRLMLNTPLPGPLFTSTDKLFPTFNLGIPDQVRYEEFARDFRDVLAKGDLPSLIVIRLPGDHTAAPRTSDGYPDASSYVADNDLALGRIVEFVSHSAIWPDSAILVVEDDAQGGVDHVDAHRSVMLAISPWIRPGTISHRHSSMGSLQKTAYAMLGLGPLNLEDALASDLSDLFQTTPTLAPYMAVAPDLRVFDPAKAKIAKPKNAEEARELTDCDDAVKIRKQFRSTSFQRHASFPKRSDKQKRQP